MNIHENSRAFWNSALEEVNLDFENATDNDRERLERPYVWVSVGQGFKESLIARVGNVYSPQDMVATPEFEPSVDMVFAQLGQSSLDLDLNEKLQALWDAGQQLIPQYPNYMIGLFAVRNADQASGNWRGIVISPSSNFPLDEYRKYMTQIVDIANADLISKSRPALPRYPHAR